MLSGLLRPLVAPRASRAALEPSGERASFDMGGGGLTDLPPQSVNRDRRHPPRRLPDRYAGPHTSRHAAASETGVAGVRVSEENFIVITAALLRGGPVETTIAVGPEGTCACRIDTAQKHFASTSPDARLFEQILTVRLTGVGVRCRDRDS